nr:ATP-dependent protease [uncultured Gammaproteobacteria bacterium]BAL55738.1 ATP-dependent protease [uncultured Gammaproteobacteria bacterium]
MRSVVPLPPERLYAGVDPRDFDFKTTAELPDVPLVFEQPRALSALRFGIEIADADFNVFVLGPEGCGKLTAVREVVGAHALRQPVPSDWCYVYNFQDPVRPKAIELPAGSGRRLRQDLAQLIEELRNAIPAAFEGEEYRARVEELEQEAKAREIHALEALREQARKQGVALLETPTGFAFAPLTHEGQVMSPEVFRQLPPEVQERIEATVEELQQQLQKLLRQFPRWRKEAREKLRQLNREITRYAVDPLIEEVKQSYLEIKEVLAHLDAVEQDILEHVEDFLPQPPPPVPLPFWVSKAEERLKRYQVNLLVDHSEQQGAPVIYEALPNHANLIGRIDYHAFMGTLVTDFSLIKPGALHRANGGYLVLDALKVLTQPHAWDTLKRTLKAREIKIESLEKTLSLISTLPLEPDPIPLKVRVILVGDRLLYYLLEALDPEFKDLFKVAADFEEELPRTQASLRLYAQVLATLARKEGLLPLTAEAVARVIEQGARELEDALKVSVHLRTLTDLLKEADYQARKAGRECIARADVQAAIDARIDRSDRLRTRIQELIARDALLIDTAGARVGQINGLTVISLGSFSFGRPARITATTRLGEGEVIDIEREAELGGAIHSKGVMILSNFLAARYARVRPLSMAASLVFEQSYGPVEGDSASLAELCALLSSLADLPVRQDLAVTGSVNQLGQVQPIGGVNEKIEGFFDTCSRKGLTGTQGVIIPQANVQNLMLRQDVVAAAAAGKFHVYAVQTVDEALELLLGVPAGTRSEDGRFPPETVNGRVERQLEQFAEFRKRFLAKEASQ